MKKGYAFRFLLFFLFLGCLGPACALAEEDVSWQTADFQGLSVHYQDHGPKAALPLVFIHGWSCNATFWRYQIPAFSRDYRVIVIDLPGFGRSDKPRDIAYNMEFFAKAVKAVLDSAKIENPVLVGHSMGYAVIRQYLTDFPGTVKAICSVDGTYFRIPEKPEALDALKKEMAAILSSMTGPNRPQGVRRFIESTFYDKTPADLRREITEGMASADPYAANSSLEELFRLEQWEHRSFEVPALAIYAKDPSWRPDEEAYLRTVFPGLTCILWEDCGHYIMLEKIARFNTTLRLFIRELGR